jgi:hypothetical protein
MLRERAFVTEGGCFTAGAAFSHFRYPFNTMIPGACPDVSLLACRFEGQCLFSKARDFTIYRNLIQDMLLK